MILSRRIWVDNYENFVNIYGLCGQEISRSYPYDHFEDEKATITSSSTNFEDVNKTLENEIMERLKLQGLML